MTGLEEVEKAQDLHTFIHRENQEAKISSKEEYRVLFLKKNPEDYLARQRMEPCYSTDRL